MGSGTTSTALQPVPLRLCGELVIPAASVSRMIGSTLPLRGTVPRQANCSGRERQCHRIPNSFIQQSPDLTSRASEWPSVAAEIRHQLTAHQRLQRREAATIRAVAPSPGASG
jgi:hypothetical protein